MSREDLFLLVLTGAMFFSIVSQIFDTYVIRALRKRIHALEAQVAALTEKATDDCAADEMIGQESKQKTGEQP